MLNISAAITEEQNKKLDEIKTKDGTSKKETIRRALDEYFKKKK